jgi:hypothetical protein
MGDSRITVSRVAWAIDSGASASFVRSLSGVGFFGRVVASKLLPALEAALD